jgi:hypothetical protein
MIAAILLFHFQRNKIRNGLPTIVAPLNRIPFHYPTPADPKDERCMEI